MLIGVSELITQTWRLYRTHWKALVAYIISFFLPPVLLFFAGLAGVFISRSNALNTATNITLLVLMAAAGLFAIWNSIALTAAIGAMVRGQSALSWKQTFVAGRRLVWPIILVGVVVGAIVFGGTILLVIPGLIFLVWYAFTYYRIILDGYPGLGATLRESKQLVRGRWFDVAVRLAVPTVLFALCSAVLQGLLSGLLLFLPTPPFIDNAVTNLLGAVIQAAIAPLTLIAGVILYQSAKNNPLPTASSLSSQP
ncbi:MAG: hypothetical protein HY983_01610 [Candidatus Magasanikbacteria bacterium]|nr:hypothetical protein [Candidatus Magasanikbacteria bacterium]